MYQRITLQKIGESVLQSMESLRLTVCGHYFGEALHKMDRPEGIGEFVLLYCIGGKGEVSMNRRKKQIVPGNAVILPAGIPHFYQSDPLFPWDIYWLHLSGDPEALSHLFFRQNGEIAVLEPGYRPEICQTFERIFALTGDPQRAAGLLEQVEANELAKLILLQFLSGKDTGDREMMRIQQYLSKHLSEKITLDGLSSQFHLSKYHLIRRFRQETGYAPLEYLHRQRITAACSLLADSEESILSISQRLGYATPYYFSEQFKQFTGYSPSFFRKMMGQNK
jgi:AraC-like DNA-binding protein